MPFEGARFSPVEKEAKPPTTSPTHLPQSDNGDMHLLLPRGYTWLGIFGDCPLTSQVFETERDPASSRVKNYIMLVLNLIDCTGRNFGQVCFANNPISGYLIFLGLVIAVPIVGVSALVASTVGVLFAVLMRQPKDKVGAGLCCYNAALLGAVMPALLLGPGSSTSAEAVWISVIVGAIFTIIMSSALANAFGSVKPAIPIMTLPFNLVALFSIVCLRVHQQGVSTGAIAPTPTPQPPLDLEWTRLLEGSFLGAGQVFAVQDMWCSGLVLSGMLLCSPLLAIAGYLGSLVGTLIAISVSPTLYEAAYAGIYGYNAFLGACAVCYFFVPTWRSALVALVNSMLITAVQVALAWAFSDVSLPVLTLPFVGASLLVLGATSKEGSLPRPLTFSFPEQHLAMWHRGRRSSLDSNASVSDP